ncbi:hypothetical protein C9374_013003 [Naegleria lovaniensis]|uniref:Uncharacterized protein n=1 Tax=Naegleria lovaniensis TaxID=51637 RepID=A0AA88GDS8_NAELO|nr:uncharacterized protein C9374_013003 [Naegleria lovaniensis]KAG2372973.1 hypothetical protein C9374_013003 [Naegleria lovaniensis]
MATSTVSPAFQQLLCEMITACAKNDPNAFLSSYQTLQQQYHSIGPQQQKPSQESISENPCPSSVTSSESKIQIIEHSTCALSSSSSDERSVDHDSKPKKISKRYTKLRKQLKACENFKDNYFVFSTTTTSKPANSAQGKKKRNSAKKRSKDCEELSTSGSDQESPRLTSDSKKRKVTQHSQDHSTSSVVMDSSFEQQYQQLMNTWNALQQFVDTSSLNTSEPSHVTPNQQCEILEEQTVPDFFSSENPLENSLELDSIFNHPTTDFNFSTSSLMDLPESPNNFSNLFSELLTIANDKFT